MFKSQLVQLQPVCLTGREELVNNASLVISSLSEEHESNQEQIAVMQRYIQQRQTEVADLQTYLLGELQNIENCRNRNERLRRIVITEALPALCDLKNALESIRALLGPINHMAVNFVQMLAQKSRGLLRQKEEQNRKQRQQIEQLKKSISEMRMQMDQLKYQTVQNMQSIKDSRKGQINQSSLSDLHRDQAEQDSHSDKKQGVSQNQKKSISATICSVKHTQRMPIEASSQISVPCFGKVDSQRQKYEQCYNQIQLSRKNINYRCERVSNSPLPLNLHTSQSLKKYREEIHVKPKQSNTTGQRKEYIKQKIKKIKTKAEGRQNRKPSPLQDRSKMAVRY